MNTELSGGMNTTSSSKEERWATECISTHLKEMNMASRATKELTHPPPHEDMLQISGASALFFGFSFVLPIGATEPVGKCIGELHL